MHKLKGFDYFVDPAGLVINIKTKAILKPYLVRASKKRKAKNNYYFAVKLYKNGKQKSFRLHRLIAECFLPNPENKPIVDHIDGNTLRNHRDNLRWVNNSENLKNRTRYCNEQFACVYSSQKGSISCA